MPESKIDLRHLMDSSTMSPDVAARLFSAVEHVEVDIMKTSTPNRFGQLGQ